MISAPEMSRVGGAQRLRRRKVHKVELSEASFDPFRNFTLCYAKHCGSLTDSFAR